MKKLLVPALAILLISGVASAQPAQTKPKKTTTAVKPKSTTDKTASSTTSVTPKKTTQPVATDKTAINRKKKHHTKAKKAKG